MNRHFVHIYATVRVKIAVDGCADHAAAIDAADNLLNEHKHQLFGRTFRDESTLTSEPTRPDVCLIYAEADDEATGYLVDEAGDDFDNSRDYGPDGRTPLRQPAPAEPPQVLVHLDGGTVQDIICDSPIRAVVIDYDTDGADKTELYDIPQAGGLVEDAFRSDWGLIKGTEEDAAFIVAALNAPPTYPKLKAISLRAEAKMTHYSEATRAAFIAEADQLDQLAEAQLASAGAGATA